MTPPFFKGCVSARALLYKQDKNNNYIMIANAILVFGVSTILFFFLVLNT